MEVQPLRQHDNRNPRTIEDARALVRHVEFLFMPRNIDALVADLPKIARCAPLGAGPESTPGGGWIPGSSLRDAPE